MRENAWKEIGVSLGLSGDVCKIRFKVLRDRYRKEKVRAFPSGSEAKARKIWPFSEMLSFLDPYMQKGSTWSNITGTTTMPIIVPCIEERIQFEEETGIVQGEDSFNLPETSQPTPITSRRQTPNSKKKKESKRRVDRCCIDEDRRKN
ncbi:MADF domain-containing protein [Trichonephila clavata]|uniref:MADF domain-containing protein n=1 Tax=Trichonephila clavata TaxID=2740835 RepID=A0A8X6GAQ7_TRICU|nr:MADF domain-containing protein [Trichonephila clavata]